MEIRVKPLSRKTIIIGLVLVSVLVTSAYALTSLFTHFFPATPAGTTQVVTTTCSGATLSIGNTNAFFAGANNEVLYTCPGGAVAFSAVAGTVSPTFTLPTITGTTLTLEIFPASGPFTGCGGPLVAITSGNPVIFGSASPQPGDYDYCLSVSNYPSAGIPGFSVTWSQ